MARRKAKFADFEDPEFLGNIAQEACKDFDPEYAAAEKSVRAFLGTDQQDLFYQYEELIYRSISAAQRLTVERMLARSVGCRQANT